MAYRFADGEPADHAIRRIGAEQIDRASAELNEGVKAKPMEAVRAARKALKKERSLLRLARGTMKSSARRRENRAFRDAGRRLSAARDADVMVEALEDLAKRYAGQLPKTTFTTIGEHLRQAGKGHGGG